MKTYKYWLSRCTCPFHRGFLTGKAPQFLVFFWEGGRGAAIPGQRHLKQSSSISPDIAEHCPGVLHGWFNYSLFNIHAHGLCTKSDSEGLVLHLEVIDIPHGRLALPANLSVRSPICISLSNPFTACAWIVLLEGGPGAIRPTLIYRYQVDHRQVAFKARGLPWRGGEANLITCLNLKKEALVWLTHAFVLLRSCQLLSHLVLSHSDSVTVSFPLNTC